MLAVLGAAHRVAIGGRGAAAAPAALAAVERLPDDPIAAADLVSAPSAA
jgi:hypothetical protein